MWTAARFLPRVLSRDNISTLCTFGGARAGRGSRGEDVKTTLILLLLALELVACDRREDKKAAAKLCEPPENGAHLLTATVTDAVGRATTTSTWVVFKNPARPC